MMISAKPTTYSSARFRSRLEAKWAAFFDLCGWRWEYEPIDLAGWVPDFALISKGAPLYVEVKPIEWVYGVEDNVALARRGDLKKIEASDREVLILGAYPLGEVDVADGPQGCIGILYDGHYPLWPSYDYAALNFRENFDIIGVWGCYSERLSGFYDGGCGNAPVRLSVISGLWRQACASVQWNGR